MAARAPDVGSDGSPGQDAPPRYRRAGGVHQTRVAGRDVVLMLPSGSLQAVRDDAAAILALLEEPTMLYELAEEMATETGQAVDEVHEHVVNIVRHLATAGLVESVPL